MSDIPGARTSDPIGSHTANHAIANWPGLRFAIWKAVRAFYPLACDDDDIQKWIERAWGRPVQRNVVARSRGLLERDGVITRIGSLDRGKPHRTLHFLLVDVDAIELPPRVAIPAPQRTDDAPACYTEVDGLAWCSTHQREWVEGEHGCSETFGITRYYGPEKACVEVPLFIKE